jgi:hypothetical protein
MRKTLLLVATLGTFAMLAAPAAAGDHRPHPPRVTSSFGLGIFLWPAPKTVHHHHPRPWHLRPQPVYRFGHSWHRPQLRHFDRRHHGHHEWRHGHSQWRQGHGQWRDGHQRWRQGDHQWRHGNQHGRHGSGRDHARHDRRHR